MSEPSGISRRPEASDLLVSLLALSPLGLAFFARSHGSDAYYLAVQEDGFLEWWTVFAFVLAGAIYGKEAIRARLRGAAFAEVWWPLGLAAFCAVVAMEEISWGQRLLGYRPPDYFLGANFQQELNLHNVVSTDLRQLALLSVIFGYGVSLPLIALPAPPARWLRRLGVAPPPTGLLPAFAVIGALQWSYPFKFAGEWVECMLGLAFLGAALRLEVGAEGAGVERAGRSTGRRIGRAMAWVLAAGVLGGGGVMLTQALGRDDPMKLEVAKVELDRLRADFRTAHIQTSCGVHRRLYTFAERNGHEFLYEGRFAGLTEAGLPEARAAFLLDPWDSPYWVRDYCGDERRAWIYSMGPNRRRDSTRSEILGDDIAVRIR